MHQSIATQQWTCRNPDSSTDLSSFLPGSDTQSQSTWQGHSQKEEVIPRKPLEETKPP